MKPKLLYALIIALLPQLGFALPAVLDSHGNPTGGPAATHPSEILVATTNAAKPAAKKPLTARWLDLDTLSHSERYRNAYALGGVRDFDNAQQRSLISGRFKFDAGGRYAIGFHASSGRYFNWAFSNYTGTSFIARVTSPQFVNAAFTPTQQRQEGQAFFSDPAGARFLGSGIKSQGWQFYVRQLYLSATPIKPVTVEFGSFGIERGYSTEITTFDDDGYLSGERIRLHDPKHVFFDEVAFTNAFFGDFANPNFFNRGSSLESFSYRQLSARKRINNRIAFSGEYSWQTGIHTLREAALVGTPEFKVADSIRIETYQRVNSITFAGTPTSPIGPIAPVAVPGGSGIAVTATNKLGRLSGDLGFASVDANYDVYANSRFVHAVSFPFNGDTYGIGHRVFAHASFRISPVVSAFGYYTHELGTGRLETLNQQGLNAGLNFDLKALINDKKTVF